jgi:cardiolipin synthase A/B
MYSKLSTTIFIIILVFIIANQNLSSGFLSGIKDNDGEPLDEQQYDKQIKDFLEPQKTYDVEKQLEELKDQTYKKDTSMSTSSDDTIFNESTTSNQQSQNSKKYHMRIPQTPILHNSKLLNPLLQITSYPLYVPKIQHNAEFSSPFAIYVDMKNFSENTTYRFKVYVVGNISHSYPSSQIWNNEQWRYSYHYFDVDADINGSCSQWYYLRFNKNYQEYINHIKHNEHAYIMVKIMGDGKTITTSQKINLLDMDNFTTNATAGGYAIGIAQNNSTVFNNTITVIKNNTGVITGLYRSEDNGIDDDFISEPGYYKIPSPVGTNYSIVIIDDNQTILHTISNITIFQGDYKIDTFSEKSFFQTKRNNSVTLAFSVNNTGDFFDSYNIYIESENHGWNISLNKSFLSLNPKQNSTVNITVIPCQMHSCRGTDIIVSVRSKNDYAIQGTLVFFIEILSADLMITNATVYNQSAHITTTFGQGEIIKIRANVRNIGTDIADDVEVSFYYNQIDFDHLIGIRYYEDIAQYQKYPSVHWDTLHVSCGNHTLIIVVDEKNTTEEFNYSNNKFSIPITLFPTFPSNGSHRIVITEVYYHTHSAIKNEYIAIYNPLNFSVDISGWYFTNRQRRTSDDTTKIMFPKNTHIKPQSKVVITQNATAFLTQTGYLADFEYKVNSRGDVIQMIRDKNLILSNNGGSITLKSPYNHTIDVMCYADTDSNISGWDGPSVPSSGVGVILKRNFVYFSPVDTNTSADWLSDRRFGIGQSDFSFAPLNCSGEILPFVSPDTSYNTVVSELRNATQSIHFNIYEFTNPYLAQELIDAVHRNVSVKIFVEGGPVGGMSDVQIGILHELSMYGASVRFIVNDVAHNVYKRYRFNHAKYLIIDNLTVVVESSNWALTGMPVDPTFGNREWGVVIRNEDMASLFLNVFYADWNPVLADSYSFEDMNFEIPSDFTMDVNISMGSYVPNFSLKPFQGNFSATAVFSPDNSQQAIIDMISSAQESIFIQQLYIYRDWGEQISPFVSHLVEKKVQDDIDIKIILNYNPWYSSTAINLNKTKNYLEEYGIEVRFHYTNWSIFNNIHNKGMVVDNTSVLISSINWNENSVRRNREAGIILNHQDVARYYADVFFYDWNIKLHNDMKIFDIDPEEMQPDENSLLQSMDDGDNENFTFSTLSDYLIAYKNHWLIIFIYLVTFLLIARDWRKRKWIS